MPKSATVKADPLRATRLRVLARSKKVKPQKPIYVQQKKIVTNSVKSPRAMTIASDLEASLTRLFTDPFTLACYAFAIYLTFSELTDGHFLVTYLCDIKFLSPQLLVWIITYLEKIMALSIFYVGVRRMPFKYYSTMLIASWLWVWLLPTATLWMYVIQSICLWIFVTAKTQYTKIAAMAVVALLGFSESFVQFQYHPAGHDLKNLSICINTTNI